MSHAQHECLPRADYHHALAQLDHEADRLKHLLLHAEQVPPDKRGEQLAELYTLLDNASAHLGHILKHVPCVQPAAPAAPRPR